MELRFWQDRETGLPHFYKHGITEGEVREVLACRGDDHAAARESRMKLGRTAAGRYLQVIYSPDEGGESAFVITAFELKGKAKKAFRRRQRRRGR